MASAKGKRHSLRMTPPRFFSTPAKFGAWLEKNHQAVAELWVGFYRTGSGKPSITWPQSVDEALRFGWIDGVRKTIDSVSYMIRFTPRKPGSIWSKVNIAKAEVLIAENRMAPAGLAAYARRNAERSGIYAYERRKGSSSIRIRSAHSAGTGKHGPSFSRRHRTTAASSPIMSRARRNPRHALAALLHSSNTPPRVSAFLS